MNLFDCFLIAVLAYSTIMAFLRGIILELFSLGGLIAGRFQPKPMIGEPAGAEGKAQPGVQAMAPRPGA